MDQDQVSTIDEPALPAIARRGRAGSRAPSRTGGCWSATTARATPRRASSWWSASCRWRRHLARRYGQGGEPMDDLVQVASLGLLKAIDRFDPARKTAFSSFAVPTIMGELKRHFRDKGWSVRVPRDLQELAVKLDREADDMSRTLGRTPTPAEVAEQTGSSVEQILEAREASAPTMRSRWTGPTTTTSPTGTPSPTPSAARTPATGTQKPPRHCSNSCAPSPNASARCCACASRRTSPNPRSPRASASPRCTSRGSSANASHVCATRPARPIEPLTNE